MQIRTLGRTGLKAARLGYGAMELRGRRIWDGRPITSRQAEKILNAVLDSGINLIDTSYDYGLSEELIGQYIAHRRDEYYLATKCGCTVVYKGARDETPHVWPLNQTLHSLPRIIMAAGHVGDRFARRDLAGNQELQLV